MFYILRKHFQYILFFYGRLTKLILLIFSRKLLKILAGVDPNWNELYYKSLNSLDSAKNNASKVIENESFFYTLISELRIRYRIIFRKYTTFGIPFNVIFLAQLPETWLSVESVYRACEIDNRFNARIIVLPLLRPFSTNRDGNISQFFKANNIPFVNGDECDITSFEPDLIFVPTPFEEQRPPLFQLPTLKHVSRLAYIPYGFEIGGHYQQHQFNLPLHNNTWKIFCRSSRHKKLYKKYTEIGSRHLVPIGHPKIDKYFEKKSSPLNIMSLYPEDVFANSQKTIIWAPHFDVRKDNSGWSTFVVYLEKMLELADHFQSILLIIRPHPFLFSTLINNCIFNKSEVEGILKSIANHKNICLYDGHDYMDLFKLADALITDTSSFLFEFIPTKKPVLYLCNPGGPGLNEEGDMVSCYYQAKSGDDIEDFLKMVLNGKDPMHQIRNKVQAKYLLNYDGSVGRKIVEFLRNAYGWE